MQTYEVGYIHGSLCLDNMQYRRIALVDTDLDEKMHSSSCNKELYLLTENWAHDTAKDIKELHENGYHIYITTDHGNVYTSPWRNLTSQEKTFLFEKESRGKRHLIHSKKEYLVACTECDGMVERWRETEEEAVEQWNRRISDEEDAKC